MSTNILADEEAKNDRELIATVIRSTAIAAAITNDEYELEQIEARKGLEGEANGVEDRKVYALRRLEALTDPLMTIYQSATDDIVASLEASGGDWREAMGLARSAGLRISHWTAF